MLSNAKPLDISAEEYQELVAFREAHAPTMARLQAEFRRQLDWFKKQLFGVKSKRRLVEENPYQLSLGEEFGQPPQARSRPSRSPIPARSSAAPIARGRSTTAACASTRTCRWRSS